MRVYSPSAEVHGNGLRQESLQTGKHEVALTGLEPVVFFCSINGRTVLRI